MYTFILNVGTHINIVGHDGDMIKNSGEARRVGHGFAIGTEERSEPYSSRKVKVFPRRVCTYFLEEPKQVFSIRAGFFVTSDAEIVGGFPTK